MANKLGVYLAAPHGRFIFEGRKTMIATAKRVPITGERVVCSKEDGVGVAFGTALIGDPITIDAADFDARFNEHRVSPACRQKWWKGVPHLYLYPVQRFKALDDPAEIEIEPGTIIDMGEIECPFELSGDLDITTESSKITSGEATMPWTASDAQRFTKEADTPEKQKRWADTANAVLGDCKGDRKECEAMAVRTANAELSKKDEKQVADLLIQELYRIVRDEVARSLKAQVEPEEEDEDEKVPDENATDEPEDDEEKACDDDKPKDEKAGRRISTVIMEKLRAAVDALSEIMRYGGYADREPEEDIVEDIVAPAEGFKSLGTDSDGNEWFVLWPANAYFDREGEAFSTKAIWDYVDRNAANPVKGEAWFFHVPGSKFGTIRHEAVIADHFICQVGTYDKTPIGEAFKSFFGAYPDGHPIIAPHGWGTSHQYDYIYEDRKDGVYEYFDIGESTVLPLYLAANTFNPKPLVGGLKMSNELQETAIRTVGEAVGIPDLLEQIKAAGSEAKKTLDAAGKKRKSLKQADEEEQVPEKDESRDDEEKKDEEKEDEKSVNLSAKDVVEGLVGTVIERAGLHDLTTTIGDMLAAQKSLQEQVASLSTQVSEVKQAKEEDVANAIGTPRWPWTQLQATKSAETVTTAAPVAAGVPNVVKGIAQKFVQG